MRRLAPVLLVPIAVLTGTQAPAAPEPAWHHVHRWLTEERDRMARHLEAAHEQLLVRARAARAAELVAVLEPEPPRARAHGWGVLPDLVDDGPVLPVEPAEPRSYSLEALSLGSAADFRDAALLAARVAADPNLPLAPWVAEFRRLRERLQNLEDHLEYHAQWQVEAVEHREWFASRNRISDRVRHLLELEAQASPSRELERREVMQLVAPFRPTAGLRVRTARDGRRVLALEVVTDIADERFLERVEQAVERVFSEDDAARAARFALELTFRPIAPGELYQDGAPAHGAAVDLDRHLARFAPGTQVLTTGAASTYAWTGRAVILGPAPIARRVLAHEFAHLLGFEDAYLRAYEGEPDAAFGVVLVEWVGLSDDLMGSPGRGRLTPAMIERLLGAYGGEAP